MRRLQRPVEKRHKRQCKDSACYLDAGADDKKGKCSPAASGSACDGLQKRKACRKGGCNFYKKKLDPKVLGIPREVANYPFCAARGGPGPKGTDDIVLERAGVRFKPAGDEWGGVCEYSAAVRKVRDLMDVPKGGDSEKIKWDKVKKAYKKYIKPLLEAGGPVHLTPEEEEGSAYIRSAEGLYGNDFVRTWTLGGLDGTATGTEPINSGGAAADRGEADPGLADRPALRGVEHHAPEVRPGLAAGPERPRQDGGPVDRLRGRQPGGRAPAHDVEPSGAPRQAVLVPGAGRRTARMVLVRAIPRPPLLQSPPLPSERLPEAPGPLFRAPRLRTSRHICLDASTSARIFFKWSFCVRNAAILAPRRHVTSTFLPSRRTYPSSRGTHGAGWMRAPPGLRPPRV